ncbi:glycine receptor subunit alpha-1-like isoform X1 [Centruroides sculpturatus]|uniref:glycine receptor subunit alpha-1-like isoform X1 n=2 Tax=Centruroides sculpturatus TaxID=218467 RepID=UPI000C6DB182|nr:glycine receptor subunit alpha-1-like isoform X1 [Centruroides sculpturatus]
MYLIQIYLFTIHLFFLYGGKKYEESEYFSITQLLPQSYDREEIPIQNVSGKTACTVNTNLVITTITMIKPETMTFNVDLIVVQTWQDHRLLEPKNINLPRKLDPEWAQELWLPDTYIHSVHGNYQKALISNQIIYLHANHTLLIRIRLFLTLSCFMDLHKFPHDVQICRIGLQSQSYSMDELIFRWSKAVVFKSEIILPEFRIVNVESLTTQVQDNDRNSTVLIAVIHFERRQQFYFLYVYVPSVLEVFICMLSFAFDVDQAVVRVGLLSISILTLVIQRNVVFVPSAFVKAIDIWYCGCITLVFSSIIEYAIVYRLHLKWKKRKENIPRFVPPVALNQMTNKFNDRTSTSIDRTAGILLLFIFCVLIISYVVFYSPRLT